MLKTLTLQDLKNIFKNQKIALVTGGTFGHIYPAIKFQQIFSNSHLFVEEKYKHLIISQEICSLDNVSFFNFPAAYKLNILFIWSSLRYFIKIFKQYDVVIVFGSYVTIPAIIAAFLLRKKRYFHEQNSILGLANKIAYYLGFSSILSFPMCLSESFIFSQKHYLLGLISEKDKQPIEKVISMPYIFVTAGSGGSSFFDIHISKIINKYALKNNYKLYFGAKDVNYVKSQLHNDFVCKEYFHNFNELIANASFVISRAGAGSLTHILKYNTKALLIPLKNSANNHQLFNAQNSTIPYLEEKNIKDLEATIEKYINITPQYNLKITLFD